MKGQAEVKRKKGEKSGMALLAMWTDLGCRRRLC